MYPTAECNVYFSVTCCVCSIKICAHITNNTNSQKSQLKLFITLTDADYHANFEFLKDIQTDYNKSLQLQSAKICPGAGYKGIKGKQT
jgi:hypothetical protein